MRYTESFYLMKFKRKSVYLPIYQTNMCHWQKNPKPIYSWKMNNKSFGWRIRTKLSWSTRECIQVFQQSNLIIISHLHNFCTTLQFYMKCIHFFDWNQYQIEFRTPVFLNFRWVYFTFRLYRAKDTHKAQRTTENI